MTGDQASRTAKREKGVALLLIGPGGGPKRAPDELEPPAASQLEARAEERGPLRSHECHGIARRDRPGPRTHRGRGARGECRLERRQRLGSHHGSRGSQGQQHGSLRPRRGRRFQDPGRIEGKALDEAPEVEELDEREAKAVLKRGVERELDE